MNKIPFAVAVIFAAVFWGSAGVILIAGVIRPDLGFLRWVALPDAAIAAFFTWLAAQRWMLR